MFCDISLLKRRVNRGCTVQKNMGGVHKGQRTCVPLISRKHLFLARKVIFVQDTGNYGRIQQGRCVLK